MYHTGWRDLIAVCPPPSCTELNAETRNFASAYLKPAGDVYSSASGSSKMETGVVYLQEMCVDDVDDNTYGEDLCDGVFRDRIILRLPVRQLSILISSSGVLWPDFSFVAEITRTISISST